MVKMATKKQLKDTEKDITANLHTLLLTLEYAIHDMTLTRDEVKEQAKELTKEIAQMKKRFEKLKGKYENEIGGHYFGIDGKRY